MSLYLLRHCESEFNCGKNITACDVGLSIKGIEQAKLLNIKCDLLILSPMKRCIDTLKYSNIIYKQKIIEPLCREYKTDYCDFFENEQFEIETEDKLLDRISKFREKYNQNILKQNILVLCHADFIFYYTSKLVEKERFGQWVDNGEIIKYK